MPGVLGRPDTDRLAPSPEALTITTKATTVSTISGSLDLIGLFLPESSQVIGNHKLTTANQIFVNQRIYQTGHMS